MFASMRIRSSVLRRALTARRSSKSIVRNAFAADPLNQPSIQLSPALRLLKTSLIPLMTPLERSESWEVQQQALFQRIKREKELTAERERSTPHWTSWYHRCLAERPILTKAVTCFVGAIVGDALAQRLSAPIGAFVFDAARNVQLASFGLLIGGTTAHYWHAWLEHQIFPREPRSPKAVISKLALDQSVFAPASNLIFLTWMHLLGGGSLNALMPYIVTTLPKVLIANWAVWPAANYIAFRFVPADMRILYANCLGVLWVIYVSAISH